MKQEGVMGAFRILGVYVKDRVAEAGAVQNLLTKYGCNIRTRVGLHPVDQNQCSPNGLILLELFGDPKDCDALEKDMTGIRGTVVRQMLF